jgi:hypothetical protein
LPNIFLVYVLNDEYQLFIKKTNFTEKPYFINFENK